jgi:hypothetical protein
MQDLRMVDTLRKRFSRRSNSSGSMRHGHGLSEYESPE